MLDMIDCKEKELELIHTEENMNHYWTHRSESYSDINNEQLHSVKKSAWEQALFADIDESRPLEILDIGTGPGLFAIISALRGHHVTAVDMNAEMLCKASENAEQAKVKVKFQQVGHVLPFEPESFDLIISRDVTWTLTEPEETLMSWGRLLKKNGIIKYFDAEWYYYLKNKENMRHWLTSRETILKQGGSFYVKSNEMEELAKELPMTYKDRPQWDIKFWQDNGFPCDVRESMNPVVYSEKEQIQYQNYSVFLVTVKKR